MSNKAVTQMTDPEYKVEFDGKEMYVMCNGVKLDLLSLSLEDHDRAAISKGIQSLQDDLRWAQEKFERGN